MEDLQYDIDRDAKGIKCSCGGYAERVNCTAKEIEEHDCGRGYECCSRAFVCCICGKRIIGEALAPEME